MSQSHTPIYLSPENYNTMAKKHRIANPGEFDWTRDFDDCVQQSSKWTGSGDYQYQYWFHDMDTKEYKTDKTNVVAAISRYGCGPFFNKLEGNGCFYDDLETAHENDVFRGWKCVAVEPWVSQHREYDQEECIGCVEMVVHPGGINKYRFFYRGQEVHIDDSPCPARLQMGDCESYYYFKETDLGATYHWFNRGDAESYIRVQFDKKL